MPKLKPDASEARRTAMLAAAEQCFRSRGFHQTSIKDICSEGGFSSGALYLYFPSKEALIEELVARQIANARDLLADLPGQPDLLGTVVDLPGAWADDARNSDNIAINADIIAEALRNPRIGGMMVADTEHAQGVFTRAVEAAQARNELPQTVDAPAMAGLLLALSDGLMIRHLLNPDFDASAILACLRTLCGQRKDPRTESVGAQPAPAPRPRLEIVP